MASLELLPNPKVLVVNTTIFLANIVIIKKLFVDPFLQRYDLRDQATTGLDAKTHQLRMESETISKQLETELKKVSLELKSIREAIVQGAQQKRNNIIQAAQQNAKEYLDGMRAKLAGDIKDQVARVGALSKKLADEFYAQVVS